MQSLLIQILLGINDVPPFIPIDEADHVDWFLRKVLLKMLIERIMSPLIRLVHLNNSIMAIYQLVIIKFCTFLLRLNTLLALQVLIELSLRIHVHLLIKIFK